LSAEGAVSHFVADLGTLSERTLLLPGASYPMDFVSLAAFFLYFQCNDEVKVGDRMGSNAGD
jgi:hypothetical protein